MRKVVKINERITLMIDNNSVNILDDKTFIPMSIGDLRLIIENLEIDDEKEKPKRSSRAKPKAEELPTVKELPANPFAEDEE